jgi:hypothetical protein
MIAVSDDDAVVLIFNVVVVVDPAAAKGIADFIDENKTGFPIDL